jgi:hypothetical protein
VEAPRQVSTELINKLAHKSTEFRSYMSTDAGVYDIVQRAGSLCFRRQPPKDPCNGGTHPMQLVPQGIPNLSVLSFLTGCAGRSYAAGVQMCP